MLKELCIKLVEANEIGYKIIKFRKEIRPQDLFKILAF